MIGGSVAEIATRAIYRGSCALVYSSSGSDRNYHLVATRPEHLFSTYTYIYDNFTIFMWQFYRILFLQCYLSNIILAFITYLCIHFSDIEILK